MKKSLLLGITLALAVGASTGALLANKPISKSAKAADGDIVTDTFTVDSFPNIDSSDAKFNVTGSSGAEYEAVTRRGRASDATGAMLKEQYNSFVFTRNQYSGGQSGKTGIFITKTSGYVKHIGMTLGSLNKTSGIFYIFASNEKYTELPYSNDFETETPRNDLIESYSYSAGSVIDFTFEDNYKYFGIIANSSASTAYILSLSIDWELHDFGDDDDEEEKDDIEWNLEDDELVLEYQDVFQVECTTKGTGESTGGEVIWETGDPLVATVDQDGTVTATGGGYTTITATYGDIYIEGDVWVYEEFNCPTITRSITGSSNTIFRLDDETELHEGDIIMIVCESENKVMGSVENDDGAGIALDATIADHKLTDYDEENVCYFFVSGNATDGFIFTSNEGQAISYSSTYGLEANGSKYRWSVSITNGVAVLRNVGVQAYPIVVQYDSSEEAFVTVTATKGLISIYKVDVTKEVTFEITDRYGSYRSPALKFAHLFLNEMHALCEGKSDKQTLEAKWNELLSSATFGAYEINDLSLMLFENASAVLEEDGGDTIQQAMALYDYLLSTYNFANDPFNRVPKSNSNRLVVANANEVMIIVSVLLISTLAAAFLFRYLKGKKINY